MTITNYRFFILAVLVLILTLAACATKVERIDVEDVEDISGVWNDTDSRLVSEEMIKDVLSRHWLPDFRRLHHKTPVVIVGEIRNLSHEHINVNTFIADMERDLINSGEVEFVASKDERKEIREERKDMDLHALEETRKAMGREMGADYMLQGSINTIIDPSKKKSVKYYQVDLVLISLTDNRKVWVGQKKIKKLVKRKKFRL